jgi:hypothetical protein
LTPPEITSLRSLMPTQLAVGEEATSTNGAQSTTARF